MLRLIIVFSSFYWIYQKLLELDEVSLEFDDSALSAIAKKAMEKKTGARALRSIIEEYMLDIMYEIPSKDNLTHYLITAEMVKNRNKAELIQLPTKKQNESISNEEIA